MSNKNKNQETSETKIEKLESVKIKTKPIIPAPVDMSITVYQTEVNMLENILEANSPVVISTNDDEPKCFTISVDGIRESHDIRGWKRLKRKVKFVVDTTPDNANTGRTIYNLIETESVKAKKLLELGYRLGL